MAAFIELLIGFLLIMGVLCRVLWYAFGKDTWAYDREFLWEKFDLSQADDRDI